MPTVFPVGQGAAGQAKLLGCLTRKSAVPLRGTCDSRESEFAGCAALHPRLFTLARYAVAPPMRLFKEGRGQHMQPRGIVMQT